MTTLVQSNETTIEVVRDKKALPPLRDQWNALADRMENPLLRHEWIVSAANSSFSDDEIHFLVYREHGQICAIAPLVKIGRGLKRLCLIGYLIQSEPADFLYRDEESLETLMRAVARQRYPLRFRRIPRDSPILDFDVWRPRSPFVQATIRRESDSPFLAISSSWDDFCQNLTSKNRNDLKRAYKKASRAGSIDFEFCRADRHTNARHFQDFLSVEKNSWKTKNGTALTSIADWRAFFEAFTSQAADGDYLYYACMRIGGQLIAAQFFTIQYDKLWTIKIAHDERHGYCSPGVLLMREVIRFAFDNKLRGVEFLGFSEPWLNKWTTGYRFYVDFAYSPFSLAGLADRVVCAAVRGWQGFRRRRSSLPGVNSG